MHRNCECCGGNYGTGKSYGEMWDQRGNLNTESKGLCEFCNPNCEKWFIEEKECHAKR